MGNIENELRDLTTAAKKLGAKEFAYLLAQLNTDEDFILKVNKGLDEYVDYCSKE